MLASNQRVFFEDLIPSLSLCSYATARVKRHSFPGPIIDGYHLFKHNHVSKRSTEPHGDAHREIEDHEEVVWAEQQRVLSRKKRQLWRIPRPQLPPQGTGQYVDKMKLNDQRFVRTWPALSRERV